VVQKNEGCAKWNFIVFPFSVGSIYAFPFPRGIARTQHRKGDQGKRFNVDPEKFT
jgi:hypothetical protein